MRVLHIITTINRGGAENHLLDLIQGQRAEGKEVAVAYLRGEGYWADTYREAGVEVHNLGLRRYYGELAPLLKLRRIIRGSAFDLLHAHLPPAELYTRLALLGIGRKALPLLISKHNEEGFYRGPGERFMGRWVAQRAERVICISRAVERFMAGPRLGLDGRKLQTVYYGIDAQRFSSVRSVKSEALRKEWGIPPGAMAIGFAGRLVPQKDLATLIRGFALMASQMQNAWLVMVGIGPLEAELRRCAEELGAGARIVWAGFRDDIAAVMGAFDVFALTSLYEGFGLVLLEAMASGVPVVATKVSAIPEVVIDGKTGMLVKTGSPEELASAFCKLGDKRLRLQLGAAGRQRVLENFTLERMRDETDAIYQQCQTVDDTRIKG